MLSDQDLHCILQGIAVQNIVKLKKRLPETPKTRNGLIQMVRMGKSAGQKGLRCLDSCLPS